MTTGVIRIHSGNLEDDKTLGIERIILRGVLDPQTLKFINMDWYQRERGFSTAQINEIMAAYFSGSKLADITLGMRGQNFRTKGDLYMLNDRCYCIDGGQRLYAAAAAAAERPDLKVSLGVKVYFDTTEEFENDLFCKLGTTQVRISPSVLLRNRKKKSAAAQLLVEMDANPEFALKDRISWDQRKSRHDLMSGYTFSRIVANLHAHKAGSLKSNKLFELLDGMDRLINIIGTEALRLNIIRFFNAIDRCWTIRNLSGGHDARPHMKPLFLMTIARLLSRYPEFWDGKERNEFYFGDKYVRRMRGFKLSEVVNSKLVSRDVLSEVIRKRLNLNALDEAADAEEEEAVA
jgi:hypothetical protein